VLGFVLVLFGLSFISAGSCYDNQTIMRLYSSSNSHVSTWNESISSYLEETCYDDVFGQVYTNIDPHVCTSANRVLSLSNTSNAHASNVTGAGYDVEVCYGDLDCVYDTGVDASCSNDGEIVARMFSGFNTHISNASDGNYPVKVCCVSPSASGRVYWSNMDGEEISQSNITKKVKLIAEGVSSGTFVIWDEDAFFPDEIREIEGVSIDSDLVGIWEITQSDYDRADDIGEDFEQFYFEINEKNSSYLSIGDEEDDPIIIDIISPGCGEYYDEGDALNITITAYDADDEIVGTVTFGDQVFPFTNGVTSFLVDLDFYGSFQILVEASNGHESVRIIDNIMILGKTADVYVDGEYVAACITEPKDLSRIDGTVVNFSASATRGMRVVDGFRYLLVPDHEDLFAWNWTFSSPGVDDSYANFPDTVYDIEAYNFTRRFFSPGDNSASLIVSVSEDGEDGTCIDELCP